MIHSRNSMNLLERMAQYLLWADKTIWESVQRLSDDEFGKSLGKGGGSIKKRYIHLAQDTWEWYHDWVDKNPEEEPDFGSMTRDALFSFLADYVNRFFDMINEGTVDRFTFESKGKDVTIEFDEIIFHLINHASYHRGQIAMGLRLLGKEVQMTDYVPYRIATS
jgi:uncharacterized damage-inducible protein DinB